MKIKEYFGTALAAAAFLFLTGEGLGLGVFTDLVVVVSLATVLATAFLAGAAFTGDWALGASFLDLLFGFTPFSFDSATLLFTVLGAAFLAGAFFTGVETTVLDLGAVFAFLAVGLEAAGFAVLLVEVFVCFGSSTSASASTT